MTTRTPRWLLPLALLLLLAPRPLHGQEPAPLEGFVERVARLWGSGNADALVELATTEGRILLDTGSGTQAVDPRHAAAALRELFGERESLAVRPARVTLAGGRPPRGFGELTWLFRVRGGPTQQSRSVYVGTVWEDGAWRINELRVMS